MKQERVRQSRKNRAYGGKNCINRTGLDCFAGFFQKIKVRNDNDGNKRKINRFFRCAETINPQEFKNAGQNNIYPSFSNFFSPKIYLI